MPRISQAWRHRPIIPARQEGHEFESSPRHRVNSRLVWATQRDVVSKKEGKKKKVGHVDPCWKTSIELIRPWVQSPGIYIYI